MEWKGEPETDPYKHGQQILTEEQRQYNGAQESFQQMVLEQRDAHMQRNESRHRT